MRAHSTVPLEGEEKHVRSTGEVGERTRSVWSCPGASMPVAFGEGSAVKGRMSSALRREEFGEVSLLFGVRVDEHRIGRETSKLKLS